MAQTTIATIAETILKLAAGFQNPTSVAADLSDAVLALNTYESVAPNSVLGNSIASVLGKSEASIANLANGQVAQVLSYPASFNGTQDTVDVYCVRRSSLGGGDLVILPASVKTALTAKSAASEPSA